MGVLARISAFASLTAALARIAHSLTQLHTKADAIMAQVKVNQADLDDLDEALDQIAEDLANHIDTIDLPDADLSALKADVDALRALTAPAPTEDEDDEPHPDNTLPSDL